jgi:hypothetical protein
MGELINLNPPAPIADGDLPPSIARDAEYLAGDSAHVNAAHPHSQYLLPNESDARYRQQAQSQIFINPIKSLCKSTGPITAIGLLSGNAGLEIQADTSTSASFFYFSRPGIYGVHFGLDTTNQLGVGGGNLGAVFYRVFHEGSSFHARMPLPSAANGAGSCGIGWNSVSGTAEFCDYANTGTGDAYNFYRVPGSASNVAPAASNRISRIDASGAYLQVSDKRVKKNFIPAPGLSTIVKLTPLSYEHWEALGFDEKRKTLKLGENFIHKLGFIAQDVQEHLPEAVSGPSSEEDLHSLDYNGILTVAVQAIKELHEKVAFLELQVKTLSKA